MKHHAQHAQSLRCPSQVQGKKGDFRQNIFAVDMFGSVRLAWAVLLVSSASAQLASELTKEQLKPLTVFRQQHRRLATNVSTLGAQTRGPMQRNAVEQLHVCVLLGPEPRRRKRERVLAALREIARVVLRSLCRLARVNHGAIAASGWKSFRLALVQCGCVLSARMRAANAPPCCGAVRMCLNSLWLAVVDYDALRSSAAAGAVAAAEKVKSYVVKFGKAQRASESYDWVLMLSAPSDVSQVQGKKGDFRQNIFAVDMFGSARLAWAVLLVSSASAQLASELTKEQLKPLTVFRQQHRRLVDGRLCAAAFVQDKRVYTGCTDARPHAAQCC
ncbi:unnamed protein product [Effrenium voratum]|nr:unnamed protein product [Effrenium voratum]